MTARHFFISMIVTTAIAVNAPVTFAYTPEEAASAPAQPIEKKDEATARKNVPLKKNDKKGKNEKTIASTDEHTEDFRDRFNELPPFVKLSFLVNAFKQARGY